MMIQKSDGKVLYVELESVLLKTLAFIAFIASWWDGTDALIVGLVLLMLDAIKYPYPVVSEVQQEGEEDGGSDDDGMGAP